MTQPYPLVTLRPAGPSPRFSAWVGRFGVGRLARSLGVTRGRVHAWVTPLGVRHTPRIGTARQIVALSTVEPIGIGPLRLDDVVGAVIVDGLEIRN